jgi:cytochrome c oxidase subunit 2
MNDLLRRLLFLPPQATELARRVDGLHHFVIIVTFIASTALGVLAVYYMARYRRRFRNQATQRIECPFWLETLFVLVPLTLFLVWFRIGFAQFIDLSKPPLDAMDVYVMGKKWMWKFAYPGGPNGVNVLRVPAGRPVRLLITSRDVIHSFYVPAFRLKQDALPARYTQTWFTATQTGTFPVFCAEYCGTDHSRMRAQVVVMEPEAFDRWLADEERGLVTRADTAGEPAPETDLPSQGERLAAVHGCLKCHSLDGTTHIGPSFKDLYKRTTTLVDNTKIVADEAYITESMMDPAARQVAGYRLEMPSYRGKIQPMEVAAIIEYLRTLRSTGDEPPIQGPTYERIGTR